MIDSFTTSLLIEAAAVLAVVIIGTLAIRLIARALEQRVQRAEMRLRRAHLGRATTLRSGGRSDEHLASDGASSARSEAVE